VRASAIDSLGDLLFEAWRDRRRVFVFGNGGSAATASHHVADYVKTAAVDGHHRLDATCIGDNRPLETAIANDLDYERVFEYPLSSWARRGDVAVAISGSGNSPNVTRACAWARAHDLTVVGITGFKGGELGTLAHLHINVPSTNYGVIEDLHLSVGHMAAQRLHALVLGVVVEKHAAS